MTNIVKINIKDTIKNPSYLFMLLMTCIIPMNAILKMTKIYSTTNGMSFLVVFTYLVFNVAIFAFLALVTIATIVISEKTSGRCEYYLANRVNIWTLVKAYCLSAFLLCFIPVVLFNFLILVFSYFKNIAVIVELIVSFRFALFFLVFILFCLCITMFLTVLTMISTKPEKIRFYLSLSSFSITYATVLPMKLLIEMGFTFDSNSIIYFLSLVLLAIGCIFTMFLYFMSKKLSAEIVVLSYKQ